MTEALQPSPTYILTPIASPCGRSGSTREALTLLFMVHKIRKARRQVHFAIAEFPEDYAYPVTTSAYISELHDCGAPHEGITEDTPIREALLMKVDLKDDRELAERFKDREDFTEEDRTLIVSRTEALERLRLFYLGIVKYADYYRNGLLGLM